MVIQDAEEVIALLVGQSQAASEHELAAVLRQRSSCGLDRARFGALQSRPSDHRSQ